MNFDDILDALANPSAKHTMLYINLALTLALIIVMHLYCKSRQVKPQPVGVRSLEDELTLDEQKKLKKTAEKGQDGAAAQETNDDKSETETQTNVAASPAPAQTQ